MVVYLGEIMIKIQLHKDKEDTDDVMSK